MARPIGVVSAAKFARGWTANITVYLGFVEVTMGQLNFIHCAANGTESQEVGLGDAYCEHLLDNKEASFPTVFIKPNKPIWEDHISFTIPLINSVV